MATMKALLAITNHPPDKWPEEQKKGWDKIDYIPFPNVPPDAGLEDVAQIATSLAEKIREWIRKTPQGKVCLQGDYTLCYLLYRAIDDPVFVFPTTERIVTEEIKDGKPVKTSTFAFRRWR